MPESSPRFETLWRCAPGAAPLAADGVCVRIGPQYNRVALDEHGDSAVIAAWEGRRRANPDVVLFNGTKFRLDGVSVCGPNTETSVELRFGVTDYRSLCATNFASDPGHPPVDAATGAPVLRRDMAAACGVEALVITASDDVVLFRRSDRVAENPGWYCCPGGHAEPSAALKRVASADDHGQARAAALASAFPHSAASMFARCDDRDAAGEDPESIAKFSNELSSALASTLQAPSSADGAAHRAVVEELFQSPVDEVVEELGVPKDKVRCEGLCGVVVASNNAWKPDLVFRVRVDLTTEEVLSTFASGTAAEAFESTGKLLTVPLAQLRASGGAPPDTDGVQITPPSLACLSLAL